MSWRVLVVARRCEAKSLVSMFTTEEFGVVTKALREASHGFDGLLSTMRPIIDRNLIVDIRVSLTVSATIEKLNFMIMTSD